jgi:hypothetical protein
MKHGLLTLFTSPARTAVLELLCRVNTPLHLRAIAELTSFTSGAIQKVLSKLTEEEIINSEPKSNKIFFSLNDTHEVSQYLRNVVNLNESISAEAHKSLGDEIEFALNFTDEAYELKYSKKPKRSASKLFQNITALLLREKCTYKITNDLAAAVFRDQIRNITSINLAVYTPEANFQALSKKIRAELPSFATRRNNKSIFFQTDDCPVSLTITNQVETTARFPVIKTSYFDTSLLLSCPEEIIVNSAKSFLEDPTNLLALDDIQAILRSKTNLDYPLIISNIVANRSPLHASALEFAPKALKNISKGIERKYGPFPQLYDA